MKKKGVLKKGAASFYIVAFSTLILVVIATSFAMVIMSEISRSMNDDLSQSAYDSALAGVEDAKIFYSNYRRCAEAGTTVYNPGDAFPHAGSLCEKIMWYMANPSCDMVGQTLYGESGEITVGDVAGSVVSMNQAYTCVQLIKDLDDYRSSLGSRTGTYVKTIRTGIRDGGTNTVDKIRISWYSVKGVTNPVNRNNIDNTNVAFQSLSTVTAAAPPTLEVQIVQTAAAFNLTDFDETVIDGDNSETNRATMYLVPTIDTFKADGTVDSSGADIASSSNSNDNHIGAWNGTINTLSKEQVARTNDRTVMKKPFMVYCSGDDEFYCSAEINLPNAIGETGRANDTFLVSVAIPYKDPDTDFRLELICTDGSGCGGGEMVTLPGGGISDVVKMRITQVAIDSTGRANDLYRRVETRLETKDDKEGLGKESPYYALQILGTSDIEKNMTVTYESHFGF